MKAKNRHLRFVEDSTYQRRVGKSKVPEHVRGVVEHYRRLAAEHAYQEIVKEGGRVPPGAPETPYVLAFVSYALAALGRHSEAVRPAMCGILTALERGLDRDDPPVVAKLMNMYAWRVIQGERGSPWKAINYALRGWNIADWDEKVQDAWNCITTAAEARLIAADGESDRSEAVELAIRDINAWMTELALRAGRTLSYEAYPDLVGYLHRNIGLERWRTHPRSRFHELFGHIKPPRS
jgi:hypothetical protein